MLTALIEDSPRRACTAGCLATAASTPPTAAGDGLQPGVDLDDTVALLDHMDSGDAGLDVNVLVYAHREELALHEACRRWLEETLGADAAFGIFDAVLSGFVRVVTHPRVFNTPSLLEMALAFANAVREHPNRVRVQPGPRHWSIFERLCRERQRATSWPTPTSPRGLGDRGRLRVGDHGSRLRLLHCAPLVESVT